MTVKEGVLRFSRTEQLIGADGLMRLRRARIAVVGVGSRILCGGSFGPRRRRLVGPG